ncbi:hypothetical protein C2W64_00472 [Brevibacillus laterosporus]|nr:hypothetical protein C2W64_00472 [Brevibacillus laterosporus]
MKINDTGIVPVSFCLFDDLKRVIYQWFLVLKQIYNKNETNL